MKKIALLSDTHSHLNKAVIPYLENVDEIWHAGDIGDISVLDTLEAIQPVRAVFGNIDDATMRRTCPLIQAFEIEGVKVFMSHIIGYPGRYKPAMLSNIVDYQPNLVITGHSHILKVQYDKQHNWLFMNPGAVGIYGIHTIPTLLLFELNNARIENLQVVEFSFKTQ